MEKNKWNLQLKTIKITCFSSLKENVLSKFDWNVFAVKKLFWQKKFLESYQNKFVLKLQNLNKQNENPLIHRTSYAITFVPPMFTASTNIKSILGSLLTFFLTLEYFVRLKNSFLQNLFFFQDICFTKQWCFIQDGIFKFNFLLF